LRDCITESKDFTGSRSGPLDVNGHGTHCAGVIAARANGVGVIGVAPQSNLYVGKVLDDNGFGSIDYLIKGIEWACAQGVDILSMSLGAHVANDKLAKAVKDAEQAGVIIVAAAGNDGRMVLTYPARYEEAISVGSVNRDLDQSSYSNFHADLDIVAPGEEVYSTFKGGVYAKLSGTSMATPFVAGVSALILAKHRSAAGSSTPIESVSDMREHLRRTATDLGPAGFDPRYGWGLIHPGSAVSTAAVVQPLNQEMGAQGCMERTYDRERDRGADHDRALRRAREVCGATVEGLVSASSKEAVQLFVLGGEGCTERVYDRERNRGSDHDTALRRAHEVCGACVEVIKDWDTSRGAAA
jgi:subtilisin family serine protease